MALLELRLLGPAELLHGGARANFRTNKALALVAYLCLEGGMQSREHLAGLLWPESEPQRARANLRSTLMYLRKPLRHPESEGGPASHLRVERGALGFNFEADYRLDLDVWRELPEELERERLKAILASARGEFMQGFALDGAGPFENWLRAQQEHWKLTLARKFDWLTERLSQEGRRAEAERAARRWSQLDPYSEQAVRRLMEIRVSEGDRAAALRAYQRLRKELEADLGVEPEPATRALHERIRDGAGERLAASSPPVQTAKSSLARIPFVGREESHRQLVEAFFAAREQGPQVVLLEGEAGVGKTRLTEEFLMWTRRQSIQALKGGAREAGSALPYQSLVEALRPELARATAESGGLDATWLEELARIIPEIKDRRPDLAAPPPDPGRKAQLYEAVHQFTRLIGASSPLVLFIDDLQWADAGTLDLLLYLCRRWSVDGAPLLLLGCLRSEALTAGELSGQPSLPAWLRSLDRVVPVRRLQLDLLSQSETEDLLSRLLRGDQKLTGPVEALTRWIYRETRGHPFYLAETLKMLADENLLIEAEGGEKGPRLELAPDLREGDVAQLLAGRELLPHGVREVVRSRLERLPAEAEDLLAAAAVLGGSFRFEWARQVAELEEAEAWRLLEKLLATGLWREVEASPQEERYDFSHDKIRDVVYTEAGAPRRRAYHHRAYELLVEEGSTEVDLARHAQRAGLGARAIRHAVEAGRTAMDMSAVGAAVEQFELGWQIYQEHAGVEQETPVGRVASLLEDLGRAHELQNDWEAARSVYRNLQEFAQRRDRRAIEAQALIKLATVDVLGVGDLRRAEELLDEAAETARAEKEPRLEGEAEAVLAHLHYIQYNMAAAERHGRRAVEIAEEIGARELQGRALNALSYVLNLEDPASEVLPLAERARQIYVDLGDKPMEIDCLIRVGSLREAAGQSEKAEEVLRGAVEASRETGNEWGLINGLNHLVNPVFDQGELGRAIALAEESTGLARQIQGVPLIVNSLTASGVVNRRLGRLERAIENHREAAEIATKDAPPNFAAALAAQLCADYAWQGNWEAAAREARRAGASEHFSWIYRADVQPWVVEASLWAEDLDQAREATHHLERLMEGNRRLEIPARRCRARLAAHEGDLAAQGKSLRKALEEARSMNLPWQQLVVLTELVNAFQGEGEEETAAYRRRAKELYQRMRGTLERKEDRASFQDSWLAERLL